MSTRWFVSFACLVLLCASALTPVFAEGDEPGWSDSAELSYVLTEGNSKTTTLGFSNELRRRWTKALFTFKIEGINAENTNVDREAIGSSSDDFILDETEEKEKTAEQYYAELRYNRNITERFFWFAGTSWQQNVPAGIDSRILGFGGVGNLWVQKEKIKFSTDYSVTYTDQQNVVSDPSVSDTYAGARLGSLYEQQLTKSTMFVNETIVNFNLDETSRWRGTMLNSIAVAISAKLALKASLRWLYENEPALESVPLLDMLGGTQIGTVLVPVDDLDTIFTTSLVMNF